MKSKPKIVPIFVGGRVWWVVRGVPWSATRFKSKAEAAQQLARTHRNEAP